MTLPGRPEVEKAASTRRVTTLAAAALVLLSSLAAARLFAVPVFEDEGTLLRWVVRARDAREWLEPLVPGKPLLVWSTALLASTGLAPLTAARGLSVVLGAMASVWTLRLALGVMGRRPSVIAGALFAVCPMVVYLERLALAEMLLCTLGAWTLGNVARCMGPRASRGSATALAVSLVLVALAKLPVGFLFALAAPLAWLLMPSEARRAWSRSPRGGRTLAAHAPVAALAVLVVVTAGLRGASGKLLGFGLDDLVAKMATDPTVDDGAGPRLLRELAAQLSWPVLAIGALGVLGALMGDWRTRWLALFGVFPLVVVGAFAHLWYSRYLLLAFPPLIVAATAGWGRIALRFGRAGPSVAVAVLAAVFALMVPQSARLILDPLHARWSPADRRQYFEGCGSGYGYPEAAAFLLASPNPPRRVFSLDGHSAYQLQPYVPDDWARRVSPLFYGDDGAWLVRDSTRFAMLEDHLPAWLVVPDGRIDQALDASFGSLKTRVRLAPLASFDKPGARCQVALYSVSLAPEPPPP